MVGLAVDVRRRLGGTLGRNDDTLGLLVRADGESVGFVYLLREQPNDDVFRRAELAYWIAAEAQGNGYATEAARLLVAHGFDRLGLHKVTAKAFAFNDASRRVLETLGFAEEGRFREEAYLEGAWHDTIRYGLIETAWSDDS